MPSPQLPAVLRKLSRLIRVTLLAELVLGSAAQSLADPAPATALAPSGPTATVLAAHSPQNASDLRLIQTQLQRVIKQSLPATVGVEVHGAAGSGVIVNKEGLVLTAAHVIGRAGRKAQIELADGRVLTAHTLGANHD